jgi:hypothetical protein
MRGLKVCEICEEEFYSNHRSKIYCSNGCKQKAYRDRTIQNETSGVQNIEDSALSLTKEEPLAEFILILSKSWARRIIQFEKDQMVHIIDARYLAFEVKKLKEFLVENFNSFSRSDLIFRFLKFAKGFVKQIESNYEAGIDENGMLHLSIKNPDWNLVCYELLRVD